ncbi:MAG: biopolymer transporter ExbD [Acidobacteria bacterium]|nr:biopolymer transporter ExbD [Acidobacteriota bacterium]
MGMQTGNSNGMYAAINVTPLIDVLLVLLIIFLVITPVTSKGLQTQVPQDSTGVPPADEVDRSVVIRVMKDRSMQINNERVEEALMGARLREIFKRRADKTVFVHGDPEIEYGDVAKAIDIAKGAGMDRVGLITREME